jgi:2-methylcitrate dehydratase
VKVSESPELCAQYPEAVPSRLSIRMLSGEVLATEVRYPTGHARNPMNDAEVEKKFRGMFLAHGNASQCDEVLKALWALDEVKDFGGDVLRVLAGHVGRGGVPAGVGSGR